ncbi:MAG: glycosyltransferase family 1 protein [Chloroflexi bacterium]|nr:MAG: glycosyltransferase family 1 protein [Chloroflexota bacterium]
MVPPRATGREQALNDRLATTPIRMADFSLAVYHYDMELASSLHHLLADFAFWGPPRAQDPGYRFAHPLPPFEGLTVSRWGWEPRTWKGGISGTTVDYVLNQAYTLLALRRLPEPPIVHVQFLSFLQKKWWDLRWLQVVKRRARALIYTVHNLMPHDREHDPVLRSKYEQVYRLADHLVVHNEHQHQQLVEQFAIAPNKISVLPLGPYFSQFPLPERSQARQTLGVRDEPVLLHFGSMRPYKGTESLLQAFAAWRQQQRQGTLLLAGPASPARQAELRALIADLHVQEHVVCRFDFIPAAEVPRYFAAADVIVLPYLHIDQSGVLPTALAWGLPAIVSDVGGFREFVGSNDFGYLCEAGSVASLTAVLARVLEDLPAARTKAARAQAYVQANHNWDAIAQQTAGLYRQFV